MFGKENWWIFEENISKILISWIGHFDWKLVDFSHEEILSTEMRFEMLFWMLYRFLEKFYCIHCAFLICLFFQGIHFSLLMFVQQAILHKWQCCYRGAKGVPVVLDHIIWREYVFVYQWNKCINPNINNVEKKHTSAGNIYIYFICIIINTLIWYFYGQSHKLLISFSYCFWSTLVAGSYFFYNFFSNYSIY